MAAVLYLALGRRDVAAKDHHRKEEGEEPHGGVDGTCASGLTLRRAILGASPVPIAPNLLLLGSLALRLPSPVSLLPADALALRSPVVLAAPILPLDRQLGKAWWSRCLGNEPMPKELGVPHPGFKVDLLAL